MFQQHLSGTTAPLIVLVGVFAIIDLRTHRIPNALTAGAAVAGFAWNLWATGSSGALASCGGLLSGLAVLLPFYLAGGLGAGDVKAMAAVGAFLGPKGALLAGAWTLIIGAILASLVWFGTEHQALPQWARRWGLDLQPSGSAVQPCVQRRFPYGLAIACGTFASVAWG